GSTTSADYADFAAAVATAIAAHGQAAQLNFTGGVLTYTGDGSAMAELTSSLAAIEDNLVQGADAFAGSIATPASTTGATVELHATDTLVTTTITDNDTATWSISGATSVNEGAAASYTINLGGTLQAGETATIELALTDGSTTSA